MPIVEFFAFAISIFLGIHFCILKEGDRNANILLGVLLVQMSLSYVNTTEGMAELPLYVHEFINFVSSPFISSILILYYFFAISKTPKGVTKKFRWMLIPVVLTFILGPFTTFISGKIDSLLMLSKQISPLISIFEMLFSIGIDILILTLIKRHNFRIRNYFSTLEKKRLNWLKILVIINLGFLTIWTIDDSLNQFFGDNVVSFLFSRISLFATLINVLWIGFSSLRQPPIFTTVEEPKLIDFSKAEIVVKEKYVDAIAFESILRKMDENKYFLIDSLTLRELAGLLEIRDKELSRIINTHSQDSFYGFINSLRVKHFKSILTNQKYANLSILGMALESGFKNKSTFYSAFRKIEGMTPKQYLDQKQHFS